MKRNITRALRDLSRRGRIQHEADLEERLKREISNKLNSTSDQNHHHIESDKIENTLNELTPSFTDESPNPYRQGQRDARRIFGLPYEKRGQLFKLDKYNSIREKILYAKGFLSSLDFQAENIGDFDQISLLIALRRRKYCHKKNEACSLNPYLVGSHDANYSYGYHPGIFCFLRDKINYTIGYLRQFLPDFTFLRRRDKDISVLESFFLEDNERKKEQSLK